MSFANWSSAKKGISYLLSGTVSAQLILLISLPLLSRLFTPHDFGIFTFLTSITSVIVPVATLRLESAAMLPSSHNRSSALFIISIASIIFTSMVAAIVATFLHKSGHFSEYDIVNFGIWIGLFTFSYALFLLLSQIALREMQYSQIAKRTLIRSIMTTLAQISFGMAKIFPNGLLIGALIGQFAGLAPMARTIRPYFKVPSFTLCKSVLREYWRFPIIFTPSALLNAFGLYAPLIFFTANFGAAEGGQLGMADRIISMPLALIGVVVGQVIDAETAKIMRLHKSGLLRAYRKFSIILAAFGSLVSLTGFLLGPIIVPWILGSNWKDAGVYVSVLALSAGIRLVSSPLSRFLILLQRSMLNSCLDLMRVLLIATSMFYIAQSELTPFQATGILYTSLTATYAISWIATYYSVKKYELALDSE